MNNLPSSLKHIAVAGNIGVGKTTLAERLSQHFDWKVYYEEVDNNPYLQDFYQNMKRWSFNLQVYFLNSRLQQVRKIRNGAKVGIQDRTIYEDASIFAPNLYEMGLMSKRDFENYIRLFKSMNALFEPPDLMIYLRASIGTMVKQISKRGREFEGNIRTEYLKNLNAYYENWISNYKQGKLLIINVDDLNFADKPADLQTVVDQVILKLNS